MAGKAGKQASKRRTKCPMCTLKASAEHWPFCSAECADRDLANWLGGTYRVPTEEPAVLTDGAEAEDDEIH